MLLQSVRPADLLWRDIGGESLSAEVLTKQAAQSFTSKSYPTLKIGRRALVAVYGPPGGGKSTFAFKFLDGIDGAVLLLSLEEGLSETVVARLQRLEIHRADFYIAYARSVDEIAVLVERRAPNAIAIDSLSVSTLTVDDLGRLVANVEVPVLFILHINKAGAPAGEMAAVHAADVVVRVDGMKWSIEKSRFTGPVEGEV
jgi:predicted ATP-dependent serine protease